MSKLRIRDHRFQKTLRSQALDSCRVRSVQYVQVSMFCRTPTCKDETLIEARVRFHGFRCQRHRQSQAGVYTYDIFREHHRGSARISLCLSRCSPATCILDRTSCDRGTANIATIHCARCTPPDLAIDCCCTFHLGSVIFGM